MGGEKFKKMQYDPPKIAQKSITCLPVIYKGFTSILSTKIREYLISKELIPSEQKGNSTNSIGCIQ